MVLVCKLYVPRVLHASPFDNNHFSGQPWKTKRHIVERQGFHQSSEGNDCLESFDDSIFYNPHRGEDWTDG